VYTDERTRTKCAVERAADVSLTGAFVATRCPDPVGTRAALRLERGGEHIVAEVEVVRVSFLSQPDGRGAGMGLRFLELSKEHRKFLARYVANAQRDEELSAG
jgi:c-di-GMP-binding flagellar brake protein YcgR